jgi:hypothetical protein
MSVLLKDASVKVDSASSRLGFERDGVEHNPRFTRYLTLDGQRAYEIGNICDTCAFHFERLEGANDNVSPEALSSLLRAGVSGLTDDLLDAASALLPAGRYLALLLEIVPRQVMPGDPADYFVSEQVELFGIDPFWGLPHYPHTAYYRTESRELEKGKGFFEFVVPMRPALDAEATESYRERFRTRDRPTALAISCLDVEGPYDSTEQHWCLAHYLLDGHHKTYAASQARAPLTLLSFLALDECIANEREISTTVGALNASS